MYEEKSLRKILQEQDDDLKKLSVGEESNEIYIKCLLRNETIRRRVEAIIHPVDAKQKIKMWQWIYVDRKGEYLTQRCFHKDELSARTCSNTYEGVELFMRADWTEIEVEQ